MTDMNELERENMEKMRQALKEVSPAHLDRINRMMRGEEDAFLPKRLTHFGGKYDYSHDLRQVELDGNFNKQDLLRIVIKMQD